MTTPLNGGYVGKKLSPLSAAIIHYIAAHGAVRFDELFEQFWRGGTESRSLKRRLGQLVERKWLIAHGEPAARIWMSARCNPWILPPAPALPDAPAVVHAPVVPARMEGPMRGPAYTHRGVYVARAGAMDFKNCASRGAQC